MTSILRLAGALFLASSLLAQDPPAGNTDPASTGLSPEQEKIQKEVARQLAEREKSIWKFGVRPNGGGFFAHSPDENIQFRLLGYAQAVGTVVNDDFRNSFGSSDVRVRRARVGWYFLLQKKYELFIEYDGVPVTGNLVEARVDVALKGDDLRVRAGKMVVPLSEEGWRSSRNYDTIERFIALNSTYVLPAEDTQIGVMLHGQILKDNKLTWYAGAWNGNASAVDNPRDSNDDKEFQVKATYKFTPEFRAGAGLGVTKEEDQTLRLSSLTGTRFAEFPVKGDRFAQDVDFLWEKGRNSARAEVLRLQFEDSETELTGGFVQFAHFLSGDYNGGFQPIVRIERSEINRDIGPAAQRKTAINALTAGFNWYLHNNVRLQVNAIGEDFNRVSDRAVIGDGLKVSFLSELQIRF